MPEGLDYNSFINSSINEIFPSLTLQGAQGIQDIQGVQATPAPTVDTPAPTVDTPGIPPATTTPVGRGITFGTPITPTTQKPTFSEEFKAASEKYNLPSLFGGLAHSIAPDTAGGRFGKFMVGVQADKKSAKEREEERAIKRTGVESQVGSRKAAEETKQATLGIRDDANKRAQAEVKRQKDLSVVYNELAEAEPGTTKHDTALNKLRIVATPAELVQLGLIKKPPTPSYSIGQVPGSAPGTFGTFQKGAGLGGGEFTKDADDNIILATPGQVGIDQPRWQAVTTTDPNTGKSVVSMVQVSGLGAGPETITSTGVGVPSTGKQSFFSPEAIAARAAEKNAEIKTDPTGNVEMLNVRNPEGRVGTMSRADFDKFVKEGYKFEEIK